MRLFVTEVYLLCVFFISPSFFAGSIFSIFSINSSKKHPGFSFIKSCAYLSGGGVPLLLFGIIIWSSKTLANRSSASTDPLLALPVYPYCGYSSFAALAMRNVSNLKQASLATYDVKNSSPLLVMIARLLSKINAFFRFSMRIISANGIDSAVSPTKLWELKYEWNPTVFLKMYIFPWRRILCEKAQLKLLIGSSVSFTPNKAENFVGGTEELPPDGVESYAET